MSQFFFFFFNGKNKKEILVMFALWQDKNRDKGVAVRTWGKI